MSRMAILRKWLAVLARGFLAGVKGIGWFLRGTLTVLKRTGRFLKRLWRQPLFHLPAILFLLTALTAGLLSLANAVMAEPIAQQKQRVIMEALETVSPGAVFTEMALPEGTDSAVCALYAARRDGALVGCAVQAEAQGYSDAISLLVGVDPDGAVTGVVILSMTETPGLGSRVGEADFLGQYIGKIPGIVLGSGKNTVAPISGATISSRALTKGVNTALAAAAAYLQGGASR